MVTDDNNQEDVTFFEAQKKIYPKSVSGKYRAIKWWAMGFMLGIYYFAPFLRWNRGPNAPDQAILIDLPARKAYWFFIEIWPQEIYIITGILIFSAIALFFVTSLLGRVWCGYMCPQTVWTDLYYFVEKIFQGDRNSRIKLNEGPWNFNKIWRITATHICWIIIALFTSGAFVLYFNDAPTLIKDFTHFNVSANVWYFVAGLTASTYLMAGFAREQVCTYMCPYARFQSAMFDEDTLIIGYDELRGEKRGKHKKGETWNGRGHCIDCTACVQVCPVGIDIRNGLQMECIACGLCVDACNNIMDRVNLPRGLIRYDTQRNKILKEQGKTDKLRIIRPRTIYYAAVLAFVGCLMLYSIFNRTTLEMSVLHDRNPLFVNLSNGDIRNGYEIKIINKENYDNLYKLDITGINDINVTIQNSKDDQTNELMVKAGSVAHYRVLVSTNIKPQKNIPITFKVTKKDSNISDEISSIFITESANQ